MPPREPRGLYLKREYFSDYEFQTQLTAEQREVYMGLWQLADDAGWLEWVPEQIAAHTHRFSAGDGAKLLVAAASRLVETGRLRILKCGCANLPRGDAHSRPGRPGNNQDALQKHQKHSGKKRNIPIPHRTVPHLTSPSPVGSPRAPVRGGAVQSIADLMPDLKPEIAAGSKKH